MHGSIELYSEISIGMDVVNVGVSSSSCFFILRLCEERKEGGANMSMESMENYGANTLPYLLQLIVIDNVLIGRARLCECVQLVHVIHVTPQRRQVGLFGDQKV